MFRARLLLLVVLLPTAGCPAWLAPPPSPGAQEGASCAADLDCASGLVCECGVCDVPGDEDRPPSCDITLDDACRNPPSPCFAACGDLTVVREAACVSGRESCDEAGVLESQCDPSICWGEPAPGEVCDDGEWVCELGRSTATGLCYTFDCEGEAGLCTETCESATHTAAVCLAGEYRCESGVPVEDCGGCLGPPPDCVASCVDPRVLGTAFCVSDANGSDYTCDHIVGAVPADTCGCASGALLLRTQEEIDAFAETTCVIGEVTVQVTDGAITEVSLPRLESVSEGFTLSASNSVAAARLPALAEVGSFAIQGNALLETLEAPALRRVAGSFVVTDNPRLPTCRAEEILAQVDEVAPTFVQIENNAAGDALCEPAGEIADGGPSDGGPYDGGSADGGPSDGGGDAGAPSDGGA